MVGNEETWNPRIRRTGRCCGQQGDCGQVIRQFPFVYTRLHRVSNVRAHPMDHVQYRVHSGDLPGLLGRKSRLFPPRAHARMSLNHQSPSRSHRAWSMSARASTPPAIGPSGRTASSAIGPTVEGFGCVRAEARAGSSGTGISDQRVGRPGGPTNRCVRSALARLTLRSHCYWIRPARPPGSNSELRPVTSSCRHLRSA